MKYPRIIGLVLLFVVIAYFGFARQLGLAAMGESSFQNKMAKERSLAGYEDIVKNEITNALIHRLKYNNANPSEITDLKIEGREAKFSYDQKTFKAKFVWGNVMVQDKKLGTICEERWFLESIVEKNIR